MPTRHPDNREKISKSLETFMIHVFKAVIAFESVQTNNTCIQKQWQRLTCYDHL